MFFYLGETLYLTSEGVVVKWMKKKEFWTHG